jgi:2-polyprenyl-6-methoxyphenol hydroxylase-like FAD-dependent oxidoreductase
MILGSILIVGAGPSGLAMGCALARQGVKARIVYSAKGPAEHSRAIGIQARTLEVFDQWGIAERFTNAGLKMRGAQIYGEDKQSIFHLSLEKLPSRFPYMLILPQSETEKILLEHAQQLGLTVERETEVTSIQAKANESVVTLRKGDGAED